jgi:hypothetical protein
MFYPPINKKILKPRPTKQLISKTKIKQNKTETLHKINQIKKQ